MDDDELEERRYLGEEDAVIAFGTDVWLRHPDGQDVDLFEWLELHEDEQQMCPCGSLEIVAGAFAPVNSNFGIERCDAGEVFDSDFDAAIAVRNRVAPLASIWYHPQPKEESSD